MSNSNPPVCQMEQCVRRLLLLMGLGDDNYLYSARVRGESPFTLQAVRDAVLQSDFEICHDICETIDHPFRARFLNHSAELENGDLLPAHTGHHGRVSLEIEGKPVLPRLAKSAQHVEKTRENPGVYGVPPAGLYYIENGRIYFAGEPERIRVEFARLVKNTNDGGVLQAPLVYENAVITNAAPYLYAHEQNFEGRDFFLTQAAMMRQMIRARGLLIPAPEQLKKAGN